MKVDAAAPSPPGKPRVEVVPAEARGIQGHPAGLISRTIANILDLGLVFAFVAGTYVVWAGVKFLWQGREFTRPTPGFARAFAFMTVVHVVYFAAAWTTSGRTFGDRLMGLRVVGRSGRRSPWVGRRSARCCASTSRSACCGRASIVGIAPYRI